MTHGARSQESAFGERKVSGRETWGGALWVLFFIWALEPCGRIFEQYAMVCILGSLLSLKHSSHSNTSSPPLLTYITLLSNGLDNHRILF